MDFHKPFNLFVRINRLGYVCEEVMVQDFGDTQKQVSVDRLSGENIVYVSPVAIELTGKPCYCPGLRTVIENILYLGANVHNLFFFNAKLRSRGNHRQVLLSPFH